MICQTANLARLIATKLSIPDLFNFCLIGKTCNTAIYSSQSFWRGKYKWDNSGDESYPNDNDWLQHYQISLQTLYMKKPGALELTPITRAVTKVSVGYNHFGFLTINHNFYMWGKNQSGQLGLPATTVQSSIKLVSQHVKWILCKYDYSFYGSQDLNCLYDWEIRSITLWLDFLRHGYY